MKHAPVVVGAAVVALLAAFPSFGSPFLVTQFTRVLIYGIFAMSLDLLVGYCGLISLGHAAFFGVAAYASAILTAKAGITSLWLALPASLVAAAILAALIGVLSLRTRGIYFIMVTLAFAQMAYFIVHDNDFFGGSDGILLLSSYQASIGGLKLIDMGDPTVRYYTVLVLTILVFAGLSVLVRSPFGRVIQGIRSNEQRMQALGYAVTSYKFVCFVLGGTLAGLAGHLYLALTSLADPSILDWLHSAQVLVMLIIGGMGTLVGPMVGAFVLIVLIDQASEFTEHWKLLVGLLVIAITLFSRGGLVGLAMRLGSRLSERKPT